MNEIRALTALRGLAAMAVVLQHFSATAQSHAATTIPSLVPHGYMAVDLFFVLSGFIMAYTYADDFAARGLRAFPDFLLKRIARIAPLNTVAVLLVVLAGFATTWLLGRNIMHDSHDIAYDAASNILMLQGLGVGTNLNGPSWSISTEFAAYFLFPVLLVLVLRSGRLPALAAVAVCFALLAATAAQHPRLGLDTSSIEGGLLRCLTQFIIGIGTFRLLRNQAWATRLATDWVAALAILWVLAALLLRIDLLAAFGFPVLIAALAGNQGRIARAIASPVPYFLGVISFSIYLLHNLFRPLELEALRALHPAPLGLLPALGVALAGALSVIPFAWLAYVTVERPGRRWVRGIASLIGRGYKPRPSRAGSPAPSWLFRRGD
jgi:peptidoglycan/LPS O-acetylase OafA/YrhL